MPPTTSITHSIKQSPLVLKLAMHSLIKPALPPLIAAMGLIIALNVLPLTTLPQPISADHVLSTPTVCSATSIVANSV